MPKLTNPEKIPVLRVEKITKSFGGLTVLNEVDFSLKQGELVGLIGPNGSGKSTLIIDTVGRALFKQLHSSSFAREPLEPGIHDSITGQPKRCLIVDQSRRGIRSPASFLNLLKPISKIYLESDDAKALGLGKKESTQACSTCKGQGILRLDMGFLPTEYIECETCKGTGYRPEAWDVRVHDITLPELNKMTLDEVYERFKNDSKIAEPLKLAKEVGLGYLVWNQRSYTLSGGEVQRLKIAKELQKKTKESTLYILDEPSVGLHMEDVTQLITVLNKLVDAGHTVIVVEHHPHILATCDWIIELGPGGGPNGGRIIATGTPEVVATTETTTAPYLHHNASPVRQGSPSSCSAAVFPGRPARCTNLVWGCPGYGVIPETRDARSRCGSSPGRTERASPAGEPRRSIPRRQPGPHILVRHPDSH